MPPPPMTGNKQGRCSLPKDDMDLLSLFLGETVISDIPSLKQSMCYIQNEGKSLKAWCFRCANVPAFVRQVKNLGAYLCLRLRFCNKELLPVEYSRRETTSRPLLLG